MPKPLVIVESPAKAKTIAGFLGRDYTGRVLHRPHPGPAAQRRRRPAAYKGEAWARLGVDVDNDFKPLYVVSREKKDQVRKLKDLLKDASELYLATDEDREGESIAWHLLEVLAPRVPVKRMVFHEITRRPSSGPCGSGATSTAAWSTPRRPGASSTGCTATRSRPVLWKKVMPGLSAGRVQSVATRLLVERERARMRFRAGLVLGRRRQSSEGESRGSVRGHAGRARRHRLATGKDFGEDGDRMFRRRHRSVRARRGGGLGGLAARLADSSFSVRSVEEKPYRRSPSPPFMTSTLQQEAGRKLRFPSPADHAGGPGPLRAGLHHLHADRLDHPVGPGPRRGPGPGPGAVRRRRTCPTSPAATTRRSRTPRRPTRPSARRARRSARPEQSRLHGGRLRLYELVWKRTVASQMADARGQSVQVRLGATVVERARTPSSPPAAR